MRHVGVAAGAEVEVASPWGLSGLERTTPEHKGLEHKALERKGPGRRGLERQAQERKNLEPRNPEHLHPRNMRRSRPPGTGTRIPTLHPCRPSCSN
ncbi:hypothetical protein GmRootV35_42160 [Variovorax sp. V35]